MDQLIEFLKINWYLAFALFVVLFLLMQAYSQQGGGIFLSNQSLLRLNNDDQSIIIDIRDMTAFKQGHIPSSTHLPKEGVEKKAEELSQRHKDKSIVLVCQTGVQSAQIATSIKKKNINNIFALTSGIAGWKQDNIPLSKH